jgi:hypothetical protein
MSQPEDTIYNKAKELKDTLISLLNTTSYGRFPWRFTSDEFKQKEETQDSCKSIATFSFWVPEDEYHARVERSQQYNASFCAVCGNYVITYIEIPDHIKCDYDYCPGTFTEMKFKNETV